MPTEALRRVRITGVARPRLEWAVGREVSLPVSLLETIRAPAHASELDLRHIEPPNLNGLVQDLRLRAAFTDALPHSAMIPFSYQLVPEMVRTYVARQLGKRLRTREHEWAQFPGWPLDLSADFVADWMSHEDAAPPRASTPVALTHDIDSPAGLRNLVDRFVPIEESFGARSTNYIVPRAWKLDHGLLREVAARGHEIGVHGYDHSNRTPFMNTDERRRRLREGH